MFLSLFFFFQAEDGIRDSSVTGVQTCALPILDHATIKYSTIQNWYPGDEEGRGGIYNFVTKRGAARGVSSKISWTQLETGSSNTWKHPRAVLQGRDPPDELEPVPMPHPNDPARPSAQVLPMRKRTHPTLPARAL